MDSIRMIEDDTEGVFLSKADLITVMTERLDRFPAELDALKKPQVSTIIGLDGNPKTVPSDPVEVARHEGMQKMLEGIISIIK
jgi:hypothetical protein